MFSFRSTRFISSLWLLSVLPVRVFAGNILSSNGFTTCSNNATIQVEKLDVVYNRTSQQILFDVAGSSQVQQYVELDITIYAYGQQVYTRTFDPCQNNMTQLCPVPAASFASQGLQTVPDQYASQIPSIAFSIPDLDGSVTMKLVNPNEEEVACISSDFSNGQTFNIAAVSYAAAGVAAAAAGFSAIGALGASAGAASSGLPGMSTASPSFGDVIGWFQGVAMSGMLSVAYPKVYQSFTTNFAFSSGLIPWQSVQTTIDNFRQMTGGNLTDDNYTYLASQASLVYPGDTANSTLSKRALHVVRDGTTIVLNGTSENVGGSSNPFNSTSNSTTSSKDPHFVSGIEAYVEQLTIPKANTFMTVLLVWAIIVALIIVGILLIKFVLELWSMMGKLPKSLESWRKRYWWRLAKTLTNLTLLLYGVWTLYCIYQFTDGDSWAAKLLAGITLALFTAVLAGFTWKIYAKAHEYRKTNGDVNQLYADKETWIKYSLFYDNYKRSYWWIFVPAIIYTFAKGFIIAGLNGHGMVQAGAQLVVEGLMLILLLWTRPYQRTSGSVINCIIQVVRVLSTVCVLVFVEELGISQTTKTITGLALIVVQCLMTGLLAILIVINLFITMCKENPHRKARKDAEKLNRDMENLTPLDPRSSLCISDRNADLEKGADLSMYKAPLTHEAPSRDDLAYPYPRDSSPSPPPSHYYHDRSRSISPPLSLADHADAEDQGLLTNAARMSVSAPIAHGQAHSGRRVSRQPKLPDFANVGMAV